MADDQEATAFLAWLSTFELARPVSKLSDLSDGAALFDVLSTVDPDYFRYPSDAATAAALPDNWPLRFTSLKRLFRLINQYFTDVLRQPPSAIDIPDLQSIAKDYNEEQTLRLCRLTIAIAVQSAQNSRIIEGIQKLKETDQHALMRAIEKVMTRLGPVNQPAEGRTDDDHYYEIHMERSRVLSDKETLEKVYQTLLEEHTQLQTNFDDATAEKEDALSRLQGLRREMDDRRNEKADVMLRAEIDRLRTDLQKSEEALSLTEVRLDKKSTQVKDFARKIEELQAKADEAVRLKDQVDEYRHAADKLQKTENVMEKYKKKLEESADLRRHVKALEEQNAKLVDQNAALEEEYRKVAAFKPLMESYKNTITELETKGSLRSKEMEELRFGLDQAKQRLKIAAEERARDSEALELYQERVRELELGPRTAGLFPPKTPNPNASGFPESVGGGGVRGSLDVELRASEEDAEDVQGLGGELDDALTGTTMTDLKLQIRKLKRDLEDASQNQAEASRILVLENLLDDANRMKTRYEQDYLTAHREKLVLQNEVEEIRSGKALGDGPEAAIALRQRLNETVDALDALRKEHAEVEVRFDALNRELTVAKSDLNLVNKDQLEILNTLRESVNEDKVELESEIERQQKQIRDLNDKNKMQLEQVNALLMEKVSMQTEGLGQRERMLEREREFTDLKASFVGKDLPEDIKNKLLSLHEDNVMLKEQVRTTHEKLIKARQFIKDQDQLFRAEHAKSGKPRVPGTAEEEEERVKILEEEVTRLKRMKVEQEHRYQREQALLLSHLHKLGLERARYHLSESAQPQVTKAGAASWLGQQRRNFAQTLKR